MCYIGNMERVELREDIKSFKVFNSEKITKERKPQIHETFLTNTLIRSI